MKRYAVWFCEYDAGELSGEMVAGLRGGNRRGEEAGRLRGGGAQLVRESSFKGKAWREGVVMVRGGGVLEL
jgi:hypothetical protein